ncbi:MAG: TonB family protein [Gemmatimonadetes bacterium]|nr:TonB family protein [Gemmatimonadota bacterium]
MTPSVHARWLALSLLLGPRIAARSQTGVVVGIVRDSAGRVRLGQAVVTGETASPVRAISDDSGNYRLSGVRAGPIKVWARHIGYAPETLTVVVRSGEIARADFSLRTSAAQLDADIIEADPLRGKMGAFNKRRARGVGSFITRAEIEHRRPASMSELLRYVPGVGVTQKMAGEPQPIHMQRSAKSSMQASCVVQVYVDGHPYPNGSVDDFQPLAIEGVEVYRSASEIPADFRTRDATCGVIALWTRDPEAARRQP